ncbi:MAG: cell envelope biogenesis protein OmpA [Flavobacteriales bacterium]|nr:MAG: cell envelope biogenesis protein OmpA [Flavobacteriales bacterium]
MKRILGLLSIALIATSCVSSRVHKDLQAEHNKLEGSFDSLTKKHIALEADHREISEFLKQAKAAIIRLQNDSADMQYKLDQRNREYEELSRSYDFLLENNKSLLSRSSAENRALLTKLQRAQDELAEREDSLRLERRRIEDLARNLQNRESQINELESALSRKDSLMSAVRNRIAEALLSFDGKGLSIDLRDGKVYVTLENALLFRSGSWDLDAQGQTALGSLAAVLEENSDLNVLVEGHTDSDAFNGRGQVRDNWDLSVMRATSIVRELTKNKGVDASRLTAAGRSEYQPVQENDTAENKAKNRRTEIIITPRLDELTQLIDDLK